MPTARHQSGVALKNSAPIFLARVVGNDGSALVQANLSSIAYSIYRLDPNDPDSETVVSGHSAVSLTVANVVFDTLQLGVLWQNDDGEFVDDTGYNFKFQPSIASNQAFAVAGADYLVRVTMTPGSGQKIIVAWKVKCI